MIVGIEAIAEMSRTERLTRETLQLLAGSVIGAPSPTDDLSLWLADAWERLGMLSGSEVTIWELALAIWSGTLTARVASLAYLDADNKAAVAAIITDWLTT